jgi:hypothetical protein
VEREGIYFVQRGLEPLEGSVRWGGEGEGGKKKECRPVRFPAQDISCVVI